MKLEGKQLNIFVKKKQGKVVEMTKSYDKKLEGYELWKGKELPEVKNDVPLYDTNKMWDILEKEIPALKKYRKSVRGE